MEKMRLQRKESKHELLEAVQDGADGDDQFERLLDGGIGLPNLAAEATGLSLQQRLEYISSHEQDFGEMVPPLTAASMSAMNDSMIVGNEQLRHDMVLKRDLKFSPMANDEARIKRKQRYWSALVDEYDALRNPPATGRMAPDTVCPTGHAGAVRRRQPIMIPLLFVEMNKILKTLETRNSEHCERVDELIDAPLLMQELENGVFDAAAFAARVGDMLKTYCADSRDEMVDSMVELATEGRYEDALMKLFDVLELMRIDAANYKIGLCYEKLEIDKAIEFEKKCFSEALGAGEFSLDKTVGWIRSLVAGQCFPPEQVIAKSGVSPSLDKLKNGSTHESRVERFKLVQIGLLGLLMDGGEAPETLRLDARNMGNLKLDLVALAQTAIVMSAMRTRLTSSLRPEMSEVITGDLFRFLGCDKSPNLVVSEMCRIVRHRLNVSFSETNVQFFSTLFSKTLHRTSPVFQALYSRECALLLKWMCGEVVVSGAISFHGLGTVSAIFKDICMRMREMVRFHLAVYSPVYDHMFSDILHKKK